MSQSLKLLAVLFAFPLAVHAQLVDDFSDGDFTNNPAWVGDVADFVVNGANELQSNGPAVSDTAYLTTPISVSTNDTLTWEWYMKLDFNPSNTNNARIFLLADTSNLQVGLDGYFVRIGENGSGDPMKLFKQQGTTSTLLATGSVGNFDTAPEARFKVVRDPSGNWELYADTLAGTNYALEATVNNTDILSGSHFGFFCKYSTANSTAFTFDSIVVTAATAMDVVPPVVDSVIVVSATQLDVDFSEPVSVATATMLANYLLDNGIGNAATAVIDAADSSLVHLTFGSAMTSATTYELITTNVADTVGNVMVNDTTTFFFFMPIAAAEGDVIINEIFADPTPQVGLPNAEWLELFNASNSAFDLAGWELVNTSVVHTLPAYVLQPDSFVLLCANSDTTAMQAYGNTIGFSSFSALSNAGDSLTLLDDQGTILHIVAYDDAWYNDPIKDDGGWSLETINPYGSCAAGASNWTASNDPIGGTPGAENSVFDTVPDTQAPDLLSLNLISTTQLELMFSELMDSTSLATGTYTIDNGITVVGVVVGADLMSVTLTMSPAIDSGTVYTVTVAGVTDCPGNAISGTNSLTFLVAPEPGPGEVIINELMADPTPQNGLPDAEWVELYNTTNSYFDLSNCEFEGASLPAGAQIGPNEYVILVDDSDTAAFSIFGSVIALGSFPSLTNGGEDVVFANGMGQTVDSIFYDLSWYQDPAKENGGWTLELINPFFPCPGDPAPNWIGSFASAGGTPGSQNSVFDTLPDASPPLLASVQVVSANQIALQFNEVMDGASLASGTYTIDNGITVTSVTVESELTSVLLDVTPALDSGLTYTVTVSDVNDCSGNDIGSGSLQFTIPFAPGPGDIVINELFADPTPPVGLPEQEWLELHNTTANLFDLSTLELGGGDFAPGTVLQPNGYLICCPNSDTALFSGFGTVAGIASWNFLTNGGETIDLVDSSGTVIDAVSYDISWYQDPQKDDGGWSLERINPIAVCSGANNWIASTDPTGGTPGQENSVYDLTPDNTAPAVVGALVVAANAVQVQFSEPMDSLSLASGTYAVAGLAFSSAVVDSNALTTVLVTFTTAIDTATLYTITVAGVSDCPGNAIGAADSANFVIGYEPLPGEVIINEIFADESPVVALPEAEWIELYNTGNRMLDLSGLELEGQAIPEGTLLMPNAYLVFTDDEDVALFAPNFPTPVGIESWASLTNGGEDLLLISPQGQTIDSVFYDDAWYNDAVKDDGGWSLERIDPNTPCSFGSNWSASVDPDGGTPGEVNSILGVQVDTIAPSVVSASVVSGTTVLVSFSEAMDGATLAAAAYVFNNGVFAQGVQVQPNLLDVMVDLSSPLDTAVLYTVTVTGANDCLGLGLGPDNTATFMLGYEPQPGDFVINEIMADPSPQVGLPEEEYIELFNLTDRLLDLSNCNYDGADFPPNTFLMPDSFLILADEDVAVQYEAYGSVAALSSWPTLTNAGERIEVAINNGPVIDFVAYTDEWYRIPAREDGGYSLERVNPFADCNFANNWIASQADSGGTPGFINSVYSLAPDTTPPGIVGVTVVDETVLLVEFSESMDSTSLALGSYTLSPSVPIFALQVDSIDFNSVEIRLNGSLQPSTIYTLFVDLVADCPGNLIGTANAFDFVLPEQSAPGDVIINEVLFNPVTGGNDFVEVYNNSIKNIDLANWKLANYDFEDDTIANFKLVTDEQRMLGPGEYAVLTKDQTLQLVYDGVDFVWEAVASDLRDQYPGAVLETFINMSSLPTYSNDAGTVILINNQDSLMDRFDYLDDYHYALLNSEDGVSLERIDFDRPTNDATNWHSASEAVSFATPGYENSQFQPTDITEGDITIDPEIFSPDNDGFNDVVHINYQFEAPGFTGNVTIYDARGRKIRELMQNELLGPQGTISWDGINDDNEKARIGIYIVYFEAFDLTGKVLRFKEKCVLGGMIGN